jgi:hypothetical protein
MHQHTSGFLVQRVRLLRIIGFCVIWSLIFTANLLATPTATWTTPWTVDLGSRSATGLLASNAQAFGPASTTDGAINDIGFAGEALSGTDAVAKSMSSAFQGILIDGSFTGGAEASAEVDFSRSFSLQGSPDGWSLSLTGFLNGNLFAQNHYQDSTASVSARGQIDVPRQGFLLSDSVTAEFPEGVIENDPASKTVSAPGSFEGFFRDGIYTVTGALSTSAFVGDTDFMPGAGAIANFFDANPSSGFSVRLNASPVPETINVFGAFAVFVFCGYIWFHRSRALRCS